MKKQFAAGSSRSRNCCISNRSLLIGPPLFPAALLGSDTLPPNARTVGLRTEHIRISSADHPGPLARVHWVEHLGDQNHVHLKLATHSLVTLADPVQELKAGDQVSLEFAEPLYFDQAGNLVSTDRVGGRA